VESVSFIGDESGQSLTEHTLLVAFIAMLALSIFIAAGGHTKDIWSMGNTRLATAGTNATTGTATKAAPSAGQR
jgi:Flp pilus assembly pilin Flp